MDTKHIETHQDSASGETVITVSRTLTLPANLPKSYLSTDERAELIGNGMSLNGIYIVESQAADEADDPNVAWAWLCLSKPEAQVLMALKRLRGSDYLCTSGLNLSAAAEKWGADWLDRDIKTY